MDKLWVLCVRLGPSRRLCSDGGGRLLAGFAAGAVEQESPPSPPAAAAAAPAFLLWWLLLFVCRAVLSWLWSTSLDVKRLHRAPSSLPPSLPSRLFVSSVRSQATSGPVAAHDHDDDEEGGGACSLSEPAGVARAGRLLWCGCDGDEGGWPASLLRPSPLICRGWLRWWCHDGT